MMLGHVIDDRRALRLVEEADADAVYAVVDTNRDHLARWMPWAPGQTLEGTREFIRTSLRQLADNHGFQVARRGPLRRSRGLRDARRGLGATRLTPRVQRGAAVPYGRSGSSKVTIQAIIRENGVSLCAR